MALTSDGDSYSHLMSQDAIQRTHGIPLDAALWGTPTESLQHHVLPMGIVVNAFETAFGALTILLLRFY